MKHIGLTILMGLFGLAGMHANASDLFYNPCDYEKSSMIENNGFIPVGFSGLSCQQIRAVADGAEIINATMAPALVAMGMPGVREQLATLGLTLANPAVLTVVFVGATTSAVVYLIMKRSLAECQREDREKLKQEIRDELKRQFPGFQGTRDFNLQIGPAA